MVDLYPSRCFRLQLREASNGIIKENKALCELSETSAYAKFLPLLYIQFLKNKHLHPQFKMPTSEKGNNAKLYVGKDRPNININNSSHDDWFLFG